jgi:hypothetical protein
LTAGLSIILATPTGTRDQKKFEPSVPASSSSTRWAPLSVSRLATTAPAEPAPTTM